MDGTCCMVRGGKLFKRYELKSGRKAPDGFEGAQPADPVTGDIPGWVPVGEGTEDRWHREAFAVTIFPDGAYQLLGPKVQGNPEGLTAHTLVRHGSDVMAADAPAISLALSDSLRSPILKESCGIILMAAW